MSRVGNLTPAAVSYFCFLTRTWICICLLSRSVFLRSIFTVCSKGTWLKLRSESRWSLRKKAEFSPRRPFSLMSWNTVLISDYVWHNHRTTHTHTHARFRAAGTELLFSKDDLSHLLCRCWISSGPADPSHKNTKWKKCVSLVFTTSQWLVFFHLRRFTHLGLLLHRDCLFPITAEITAMFTTHGRHINSLHIAAKRSSYLPVLH